MPGLRTGVLTELSGEAGSGKTCFCLEATISVVTNVDYGVLYLSTECPFPSGLLIFSEPFRSELVIH